MKITYRIDGRDFDNLHHALDHAAATLFPASANIQYEREPNRDGYEYLVFDDADDSEDRPSVTIFEILAYREARAGAEERAGIAPGPFNMKSCMSGDIKPGGWEKEVTNLR